MTAVYFVSPAEFRAWLARHHQIADELLVGFYKRGTGKPSLTWPQSVDEALCFGWIDGIRRTVDEDRYTIRFTPRRKGSNWSAVNIARVAELTTLGLMQPAGLKAFEQRSARTSQVYSYEQRKQATLDPAHEKQFKANRRAWTFFSRLPPAYRQTIVYWVATAKAEATRLRRLERVIEASAEGRRL